METGWITLLAEGGVFGLGAVSILWLFGRHFTSGYLGKKGETIARKEDIELLRKEIQVLTKEAETIKATISHEMWDKQRRWELNRDVYRQLLADLRTLISTYDELERFRTDEFPPGDKGELDWQWNFSNDVWGTARRRLEPELNAVMRTIYASMLSLNPEGREILETFVSHFPTGKGWPMDCDLCKSLVSELIVVGKKELGM